MAWIWYQWRVSYLPKSDIFWEHFFMQYVCTRGTKPSDSDPMHVQSFSDLPFSGQIPDLLSTLMYFFPQTKLMTVFCNKNTKKRFLKSAFATCRQRNWLLNSNQKIKLLAMKVKSLEAHTSIIKLWIFEFLRKVMHKLFDSHINHMQMASMFPTVFKIMKSAIDVHKKIIKSGAC